MAPTCQLGDVNVALGKDAFQSSTPGGGEANRAVDGNAITDAGHSDYACTHTGVRNVTHNMTAETTSITLILMKLKALRTFLQMHSSEHFVDSFLS